MRHLHFLILFIFIFSVFERAVASSVYTSGTTTAIEANKAVDPCAILLTKELIPREELVTRPSGRPLNLSYTYGGNRREITGASQIEYERRANFLPVNLTPENTSDYLQDMIGEILNRYFLRLGMDENRAPDTGFYLAPLGSRIDFFHYSFLHTRYENGIQQPEKFNIQLAGPRIEVGRLSRRHDYNDPHYIVGLQREKSFYFESDDNRLVRDGIAVRLKRWYPADVNEATLQGPSQAQSLYLKKTIGVLGPFVLRQEIQFKLPADADFAEIQAAATALVKQEFPSIDVTLRAQTLVSNQRYSVNLYQKDKEGGWTSQAAEGKKIGFMTLDYFQSESLRDPVRSQKINPIYQVEFEIFPDYVDLVNDRKLAEFFEDIERYLGAKVTTTPKYLQK